MQREKGRECKSEKKINGQKEEEERGKGGETRKEGIKSVKNKNKYV